jgi:precorrin-6Y C5,15-methyltransferase (decarboxylating)
VAEHPVDLVGVHGGEWYGKAAGRAVVEATVLVGSIRHLECVESAAERIAMEGDVGAALDLIDERRRRGDRVCVLASGDPGFFGLGRLALARFGPAGVRVHPAPSSVSLAWARAGVHWDDSVVVSAHGRDSSEAVEQVLRRSKVAVLCSPDAPPEALGRELLAADCGRRQVTVCSRLGEAGEAAWTGRIEDLAEHEFDPLSVALFVAPGAASVKGLAWGLPEESFAHTKGMITKSEVRAVALGKLDIPPAGVLWDVGAGSGSVSAECDALAPGLRIFAVERQPTDELRSNLAGTAVTVVAGQAPAALAALPDPDRVFVGGGGLAALEASLERLRPGGAVVATYASPDRASAAAAKLGNMVQICVNRSVPLGADGATRLAAENPVFVCWGPS